MCNLNILIKTAEINKVDLFAFMTAVTTKSYSDNSHGDGVYLSKGLLVKSENKIDFKELVNEVESSQFIISHQRFATSGHNENYVQPFEEKEFVFAHNGVMKEFEKGGHSDTYVVFNKFIEVFLSNGGTREQRIVKSIKEIFDNNDGSWSIAIYDKIDNALYYFKGSYTRIEVITTKKKDIMYLTTAKENLCFFNILGGGIEGTIEDYRIYKFTLGEEIKVSKIGEIEEKEKRYKYYRYNSVLPPGNYASEKREVQTRLIKLIRPEIYELKKRYMLRNSQKDFCEECNRKTRNIMKYSGAVLCDNCIEEHLQDYIVEEEKFIVSSGIRGRMG